MHGRAVYVDHKILGLGIPFRNFQGKGILLAVTDKRITAEGISRTAAQSDLIEHIYGYRNARRVSGNIGGDDGMLFVVGHKDITAQRQLYLFAVHRHGKAVIIGHGEFGSTVIGLSVFNAGNYRRVTVGCLNIAADTALFVGFGIPAAVMRMG